jgi:hypothetical protein
MAALQYIGTRTPFYLRFPEDGDSASKHVVLKPT